MGSTCPVRGRHDPPAGDRPIRLRPLRARPGPRRAGLRCHYVLGERRFCRRGHVFGAAPNWGSPATSKAAARLGVPPGRRLVFQDGRPWRRRSRRHGHHGPRAGLPPALLHRGPRRIRLPQWARPRPARSVGSRRRPARPRSARPRPGRRGPVGGSGPAARPVRRGDRLHRLGRVGAPPLRRRLPLRHQPGRRLASPRRGRRRGHRASRSCGPNGGSIPKCWPRPSSAS